MPLFFYKLTTRKEICISTVELTHPLLGGTDGHRDVATHDAEPGHMNPTTIAGLTYALVEYQLEHGAEGPVVIARDTRPSSKDLSRAAISGALFAGAEIIDLGVLPTPGAQRRDSLATVVITASHNEASDNGWKGMLGNRKPPKAAVQDISDRYWKRVDSGLVVPHDLMTDAVEVDPHASEEYIADVVASISTEFGDRPLANKLFVVDGANGAAMSITPEVFRRLGADVVEYCCDGQRAINDNCGAAELGGLKDFLMSREGRDLIKDPRFVGGVANDGDADRFMGVGIVSGTPVEINGNHVMEALANHPLQPGVVGTIYTNSATVGRLPAFEYCDNGDVHVTNALLAKQQAGQSWTRGGEFTGHLIDTTWLPSGDGVRAAAWFAAWSVAQNATFGDIHTLKPLWPERMLKLKGVTLPEGPISEHELVLGAIERGKSKMGGSGRFIVRASGTERDVVRVWAEGPDADGLDEAVRHVGNTVMQLSQQ